MQGGLDSGLDHLFGSVLARTLRASPPTSAATVPAESYPQVFQSRTVRNVPHLIERKPR